MNIDISFIVTMYFNFQNLGSCSLIIHTFIFYHMADCLRAL